MERKSYIFDVDVGIDAAMGLSLSLFDPNVNIKTVTTVQGTVKLDTCTQNTLHLLDIFNKNIPVIKGADKPLIKRAIEGHKDGLNGLGNYVYDTTFTNKNITGYGTEGLYRQIIHNKEKITYVCLGPVTNLADLINTHYDVKEYIEKIYILGGSTNEIGNITPFAETNFFIDPHAMQIVLNSGIDTTILPIQIGLNLGFKPSSIDNLRTINKTGELFADILNDVNIATEALYGIVMSGFIARPELFTTTPYFASIELRDKVKMGTLYLDKKEKANCKVVTDCDYEKLKLVINELVKNCKTQTEQTRPLIIDTDPGVDDAMAIMNALYSTHVRTILISCVGGNNPISVIGSNALHIVELCHRKTPVSLGATMPLYKKPKYAAKVHGKQGLGGYTYKGPYTKPIKDDSVEAMYKALIENKNQHTTILSLGPMTNIAMLIRKYPDCIEYIRKIVFMGGSKEKEENPYPEFNINFDPDAVRIVLDSGIPLVMVPMELGHFAYLDSHDVEVIKRTNKTGKKLAKMFEGYKDYHVGNYGVAVHDSASLYYLTHPDHFRTEKAYLEVKPHGDIHYLDVDFESNHPNALVCVDMDIDDFKQNFFLHLTKMD